MQVDDARSSPGTLSVITTGGTALTAFIHVEREIGWPVEPVLAALRDRPERLAAYLPHIDRVEQVSRADGPAVETVRRWWLLRDALPAPLRAVVTQPALAFTERVVWATPASFEIAPPVVPDAVDLRGTLALTAEDLDTLVVVRAELTLRPDRVALPPALADMGARALEDLVASVARGNLTDLCRAVEAMLDDEI